MQVQVSTPARERGKDWVVVLHGVSFLQLQQAHLTVLGRVNIVDDGGEKRSECTIYLRLGQHILYVAHAGEIHYKMGRESRKIARAIKQTVGGKHIKKKKEEEKIGV